MKTAYNLFRALFQTVSYEKALQELDARLCSAYSEGAA